MVVSQSWSELCTMAAEGTFTVDLRMVSGSRTLPKKTSQASLMPRRALTEAMEELTGIVKLSSCGKATAALPTKPKRSEPLSDNRMEFQSGKTSTASQSLPCWLSVQIGSRGINNPAEPSVPRNAHGEIDDKSAGSDAGTEAGNAFKSTVLPSLANPNIAMVLPSLEEPRSARDDPMCAKSRTATLLTSLEKLRSAKDDPMSEKSRTARLLPSLLSPNTARLLPNLPKERRAKDDPRCAKSRTAWLLPSLAILCNAMLLPN
mmetsp:Transcript_22217/g.48557  ORF Transcript_22217/g.48557 Transcript_22217/m.48557 type:complete len:261 (-) Transcript_22217:408-1190(-)